MAPLCHGADLKRSVVIGAEQLVTAPSNMRAIEFRERAPVQAGDGSTGASCNDGSWLLRLHVVVVRPCCLRTRHPTVTYSRSPFSRRTFSDPLMETASVRDVTDR